MKLNIYTFKTNIDNEVIKKLSSVKLFIRFNFFRFYHKFQYYEKKQFNVSTKR